MLELKCIVENDIQKIKKEFKEESGYTVVYVAKVWDGINEATAVWFGDKNPLNVSRLATQGPAADIQACVEAVQIAFRNDIRRLIIKTNIPYVYYSMTEWINKWKNNGWETIEENQVRDKNDFMILDHNCILLDSVIWELLIDNEEDLKCCQEAKLLARQSLPSILQPVV